MKGSLVMAASVREMSLKEIESEIESIYHYFHKEAPGVTPYEVNRLGALWSRADYLIGREQ